MKKSTKSINATIALLEKAKASKLKTSRKKLLTDARIKLAVAAKDASGPDPDDGQEPLG